MATTLTRMSIGESAACEQPVDTRGGRVSFYILLRDRRARERAHAEQLACWTEMVTTEEFGHGRRGISLR
jgi:hypothetical protein